VSNRRYSCGRKANRSYSKLVEQDQGWAFISDAIDDLPDEKVFDIARGALKHTEIVAAKIRRFLKKTRRATMITQPSLTTATDFQHEKTERGNFLCSPEHPMPQGAPGRWEHTNAHEVGEQLDGWPGGDIVRMRCDDCGESWRMELPQ